jgi:arsenite/tail-anchored protein-transporting ATPase
VRVVLFTGKGGVGKTTAAAATAALVARRGRKALVLSTDPAHSLADAFGVPVGPEPRELDTGLAAMEVDTQLRFERGWRDVQGYLLDLLARGGVDGLQAEEMVVLPGAAEVLALLEVRDQVAAGRWDAVIVDCAATAETLRLLALPEALSWYVERVFPTHRRMMRSLRPVLGRLAGGLGGAALPPDGVLDAVTRLHAQLADVRGLLADPAVTSVRLVLTPESVVVAEARRTLTNLSLYGYRVDSVLANRIVPAPATPVAGSGAEPDPWRAAWAAAQAEQLALVRESFTGVPVRRASYRPAEPVGLRALLDLAAELYGDDDPVAVPPPADLVAVDRAGEEYVLRLSLPFAQRSEVAVARSGDELVLTVGAHRRLFTLPSGLRRCTVTGAEFADGTLRVRFRPDPQLWPATDKGSAS